MEAQTKKRKQRRYALNSRKFLSKEEYGRLRALVKTRNSRAAILIKLGMYTGARAHEILNLKKIDFNAVEKTVLITGLKGSSDREIPLPPKIFSQIYRYVLNQGIGDDDKVFPFCYTILHRVWERYRPCEKTFHCLRHTFALRIFEAHRDIKLVQTALGHRSINNTMIYVDYVYSRKELKRLLTVKH